MEMHRREIKAAGASFRRKIDFRAFANDWPPTRAHAAARLRVRFFLSDAA